MKSQNKTLGTPLSLWSTPESGGPGQPCGVRSRDTKIRERRNSSRCFVDEQLCRLLLCPRGRMVKVVQCGEIREQQDGSLIASAATWVDEESVERNRKDNGIHPSTQGRPERECDFTEQYLNPTTTTTTPWLWTSLPRSPPPSARRLSARWSARYFPTSRGKKYTFTKVILRVVKSNQNLCTSTRQDIVLNIILNFSL